MSTALYRRYRPESFADVIGQEHVTDPLMAAIGKGRINHAYLFSGPRGCGKTTSARILARCLNCAQGPTPTPCGSCDSCRELARNGSGSLDVLEIDAASHGGVDDARDLRERATFAPIRDRYKIFIIDEAHMVTSAGFNALLKIVEEPPEHILFIFATTEPDKVIGTIRSRTHHYPFRLVPPEPLMGYLESLCHQENVPVAPGVLSLVVRAGGGSVRDSLSVLDQLMAGAGSAGLDYELAVALLGYTHSALLDDVVEAIAAADAPTVFGAVDRVIQTGHDPRRFVEDLLERFRDLIVVKAVPDGAAAILRGVPEDQLNRIRAQANQLGASELSRAADITNTALTEMTGATSPRLHLELLCARLLLPSVDESARGALTRLDRIERRLDYASEPPSLPAATPPHGGSDSRLAADQGSNPHRDGDETPASWDGEPPTAPPPAAAVIPVEPPVETAPKPAPEPATAPAAEPAPAATPPATAGSTGQVEMVRRAWPEIMDELARIKRITWLNVNMDAKPRALEGNTLLLAFATPGNAIAFQRGTHSANLAAAINKVLGLTCTIEVIHDGGSGESGPKVPAGPPTPDKDHPEPPSRVPAESTAARADSPGASSQPGPARQAAANHTPSVPDAGPDAVPVGSAAEPEAATATRESRYRRMLEETSRSRPQDSARKPGTVDLGYPEDEPSADDISVEESGLVGRAAIERILNGRLVEERDNGSA